MKISNRQLIALSILLGALIAMPLYYSAFQIREQNKLLNRQTTEGHATEEARAERPADLEPDLKGGFPSRVVFPTDLEPGIQICVEDQSTQSVMEYTVASRVYEMPHGENKGGPMDVVDLRSSDSKGSTATLAELGVLSYSDGTWHPSNRTFFGTCSSLS